MDADRTANDLIDYLGNFTDGKKYVQILKKYRQSLKKGSQIQFSEDDLYWISFLKKRLEKKVEVENFQNYTRNLYNKQFADFLTLVRHIEITCKV
ncbi:TPA: hypothetical protein U1278_000201 [Streptococcus suis]|nr:hypothetical protein [Streptococcus suis]